MYEVFILCFFFLFWGFFFLADCWRYSDVQVSANGNVLRSEIVGCVKMRVFLSGMPELRLGLNDKVLFESTGSKQREFVIILIQKYGKEIN